MEKLYTVSAKQKKVYCDDINRLPKADKERIIFLISECAYTLCGKKKTNAKGNKLNKATIMTYFFENKDVAGLKQFIADSEAMIVCKNGVEKKGGFLVARKAFTETHKDITLTEVEEMTKEVEDWVKKNA